MNVNYYMGMQTDVTVYSEDELNAMSNEEFLGAFVLRFHELVEDYLQCDRVGNDHGSQRDWMRLRDLSPVLNEMKGWYHGMHF